MDPLNFPGGEGDAGVGGDVGGVSVAGKKEKKAKSKKHKKHHKRDRTASREGAESPGGGIKLRIKVGGAGAEGEVGGGHKKKKKKEKKKRDREKRHRHHHKERRKREREEGEGEEQEEEDEEPKAKRVATEEGGDGESVENEKSVELEEEEEEEVQPEKEKLSDKPLYRLLSSILPRLEKMDPNRFFALPVSDKFAPGYSQIIKQPMDFSTMRSKLAAGEYSRLSLFKSDFELMCNNAMTYNTQDTIYYKTAKKLGAVGKGLLTPQRLTSMREQLPFMEELTEDELGFDIMDSNEPDEDDEEEDDDEDARDVSRVIEDIREVVRRPPGRFEAIPDDLTSQEILEQAQKAAKAAADKLRIHKPTSQLGFLRQQQDGSTSLSFLTGGDGVIPGTEKDRPVSLGSLIGKVKQGTGAIQGFREDRRNVAKTMNPLYYGAFSSHGPCYDSTFANLTKEESDLVSATYGDEAGVNYAESILNFSRNCDYAMFIVDHLLDILTGNEHRKTSKYVEEQKNLRKEDELMDAAFKKLKAAEGAARTAEATSAEAASAPPATEAETAAKTTAALAATAVAAATGTKVKVDWDSLQSLKEDGIDMSFLDSMKAEFDKQFDPEEQLKEAAQLITDLKQEQDKRLGRPPPPHFAHMPKAGEKELQLANKVQGKLVEIAGKLKPSDVVPGESIKSMLGLPVKKKEGEADPEVSEDNSSSAAEEAPEQTTTEAADAQADSTTTSEAEIVSNSAVEGGGDDDNGDGGNDGGGGGDDDGDGGGGNDGGGGDNDGGDDDGGSCDDGGDDGGGGGGGGGDDGGGGVDDGGCGGGGGDDGGGGGGGDFGGGGDGGGGEVESMETN